MDTKSKSYNTVAWFYEWLGHSYSLGKGKASKASQVLEMAEGDKVLFVGVGGGDDTLVACKKGIKATCIDIAPSMIERSQKRLNRAGLSAEFICCDIMEHNRKGYYDVVTANYFFNIFPESVVDNILSHIASLIKPGGKLMIADFALPHGNFLEKEGQIIYWYIANYFFHFLGLAPIHEIYDYAKFFPGHNLEFKEKYHFKLFKYGPSGFDSIVAIRNKDGKS